MEGIGTAINYQYANLLNLTPHEEEPTWGFIGPNITTIDSEPNEEIKEQSDYASGGSTKSTVVGRTVKRTVTGTRLFGDPVQEYLASIENGKGIERETQYRVVYPDGAIIQTEVTLTNLNIGGPNGDSASDREISFEINDSDTPELIREPNGNNLPESVTVTDVSVAVGATSTISPTVTPTTASSWCLYASRNPEIATVTADGIVKGVKAGKTSITVKCASKPSVRTSVEVTVTASA